MIMFMIEKQYSYVNSWPSYGLRSVKGTKLKPTYLKIKCYYLNRQTQMDFNKQKTNKQKVWVILLVKGFEQVRNTAIT